MGDTALSSGVRPEDTMTENRDKTNDHKKQTMFASYF